MLNAQGVNIYDPKLGGLAEIGIEAGAVFEDDKTERERTHDMSRTLHNTILFYILLIREFTFFINGIYLYYHYLDGRKSRRSSTSTPTPPATASTVTTASTVISGGHRLHKIRFNFLDSVGLVGWQLLWIADGTEGSFVLITFILLLLLLMCVCVCVGVLVDARHNLFLPLTLIFTNDLFPCIRISFHILHIY